MSGAAETIQKAIPALEPGGAAVWVRRASDYGVLGGPINAVYLTRISGGQNTLHEILKGEYKDWAPIILRTMDLQKFPLKHLSLLGLEGECIFLSDRDRQQINTGR